MRSQTTGARDVVDSRENNNEDLNDRLVTADFEISDPPSGAFRFVTLRLTGKNHQRYDCLCICALELFGMISRK